jgi:hypothetical protein
MALINKASTHDYISSGLCCRLQVFCRVSDVTSSAVCKRVVLKTFTVHFMAELSKMLDR